MLKKDKLLLLLGLCLAIIPAIVIGVAIAKYSVNFVYWDEWFVAEVVIKAFQGK